MIVDMGCERGRRLLGAGSVAVAETNVFARLVRTPAVIACRPVCDQPLLASCAAAHSDVPNVTQNASIGYTRASPSRLTATSVHEAAVRSSRQPPHIITVRLSRTAAANMAVGARAMTRTIKKIPLKCLSELVFTIAASPPQTTSTVAPAKAMRRAAVSLCKDVSVSGTAATGARSSSSRTGCSAQHRKRRQPG